MANEIKSIYVTIRVDYESDNRMQDAEREREYAATMVTDHANTHTIDEGILIHNVEICGYNEL